MIKYLEIMLGDKYRIYFVQLRKYINRFNQCTKIFKKNIKRSYFNEVKKSQIYIKKFI